MHATAPQPNRRQRRLEKFGTREVARDVPRRAARRKVSRWDDRPVRSYWTGFCDACLKPAPNVYTLLWEKVSTRRGVISAQHWCYTCYVEHFEGRTPIDQADVRSPSAVAFAWLEDQHHAGVDVDLRERGILAADDPAAEIGLLDSLRAYLAPLPDHERRAREARYFELRRLWGERRHRRRLWQWMAAEFPGWLAPS